MKNIQIPEEGPEVLLHGKLATQLSEFVFDAEQYSAGLAQLHIPDPVVDGLRIDVKRNDRVIANADYSLLPNRLSVSVGRFKADAPLPNLPGSWQQVTPNLAGHVNYALAYSAQIMADHVLAQDDATLLNRFTDREAGTGVLMGRMMTIIGGVAVGGELSFTHDHFLGPVVGFMAGSCLSILIFDAWKCIPFNGIPEISVRERAVKRIDERATHFANSEQARDLFDGVVKIEFAK